MIQKPAIHRTLLYRVSLYLMAALYFAAGINHFVAARFYTRIMPPYLPYHLTLVYISGVIEALLAVLLLFEKTRTAAAWGIVVLLIAVFPANIQMLVDYLHRSDPHTWIAVLRLPLQLPLIWWAYSFTGRKGKGAAATN